MTAGNHFNPTTGSGDIAIKPFMKKYCAKPVQHMSLVGSIY